MLTTRSSQRGGEAASLSRGVTSRHLVSRLAALLNTPLRPPYMVCISIGISTIAWGGQHICPLLLLISHSGAAAGPGGKTASGAAVTGVSSLPSAGPRITYGNVCRGGGWACSDNQERFMTVSCPCSGDAMRIMRLFYLLWERPIYYRANGQIRGIYITLIWAGGRAVRHPDKAGTGRTTLGQTDTLHASPFI